MVAASKAPSVEDFIAHIDALVERMGIDHVGLGIDYYGGQVGVASDAEALRMYESAVSSGIWGSAYPPPPHHYPLERGYREPDVRKILGENWLRAMRAVWGRGSGKH
jgi:membrane dipeptidase